MRHVIGDRLNTDLAGARAAGFPGLHVLTGVDGAGELLRARAGERPTYLGLDLRALSQPHPEVTLEPDAQAHCRNARARATSDGVIVLRADGEVELTQGGDITMDELRAACVAAWHASDEAETDTILTAASGVVTVSCH